MALRLVPPDAALLARSAPFVRLLLEATARMGARLEMDAGFGFVGRVTGAEGQVVPIFGKSLGLNRDSAAHLAADKDYTARWLAAAGLPSPRGRLVFSPAYSARMALKNSETAVRLPGPDAAPEIAQEFGFPVVVKPNRGAEGRGVARCTSRAALVEAVSRGLEVDDILRIEQWLPGRDYRLLVLDGEVLLAYERRPFSVTGDGTRTLAELIDAALAALKHSQRGAKIVADDPRLLALVAAHGRSPEDILPAGQEQPLLDNANLSTGGRLVDLTKTVSAASKVLACEAAACLGLRLAGVDMIAPDLAGHSPEATILEVNSAPGLDYFATSAPENWQTARAIVTCILERRLSASQ